LGVVEKRRFKKGSFFLVEQAHLLEVCPVQRHGHHDRKPSVASTGMQAAAAASAGKEAVVGSST
jgi:hypothetical protein